MVWITEYNADQGEYDELADHQEGEVPCNDSAIQTGVCQGALILAEPPHDSRKKHSEETRDRRR